VCNLGCPVAKGSDLSILVPVNHVSSREREREIRHEIFGILLLRKHISMQHTMLSTQIATSFEHNNASIDLKLNLKKNNEDIATTPIEVNN
jgi:hypothetical protein